MPPARHDAASPAERLAAVVALALAEDIGGGDITTELTGDPDARGSAAILAKAPGVLAGVEAARLAFVSVDPSLKISAPLDDGSPIDRGAAVMRVTGRGAAILKAERTALNFLQRMSGIATLTAEFVHAVRGTGARISDTRKTAPGLRVADKMAVRAGGGVNHRMGLYDMILIKDNHVAAAGSISAAVEKCRSRRGTPIEVETRSLEDVAEALRSPGVTRIMLDNFEIPAMREAVAMVGGRVEVEASGNVTLANVRAVAETGVDVISVGALTHSAPALDLSLEYTPETVRP